jgi:hypothetical protein
MLEATSVRVQVASVRCRVFEWMNVRVLSEWVMCRIFELKGRNNNKNRKPPKAYSCPIHHHHHPKELSTKGCHARRTLMEGIFVVLLTITQVSLQLTCQVRVSFSKAMVAIDKDVVFYNCAESFTIWETFWFCVSYFSMFASSLCIFCCKVCNLMQTLAETQLV